MNTTPEQLRLAADIIQNGWAWQYKVGQVDPKTEQWAHGSGDGSILDKIQKGYEIRIKPLSFPPIPEGMTWHKPEPKLAPLGPSDVPPGSVFRHKSADDRYWCSPSEVTDRGVLFWSMHPDEDKGEDWFRTWEQMMDYLIHRPGNLDANGKPVFEHCWKEGALS